MLTIRLRSSKDLQDKKFKRFTSKLKNKLKEPTKNVQQQVRHLRDLNVKKQQSE